MLNTRRWPFLFPAVYFLYCVFTPTTWHFIDGVDLIFHEAGHVFFHFFGRTLGILGGSLFQVLFPLVFAGYFFFHEKPASAGVVLMWVGQSAINVSVYARDAQAQLLPLIGGRDSIHDWHWLLSRWRLLESSGTIANLIFLFGLGIILFGLKTIFWKE